MTEDRQERVATLLREHAPMASPALRARIEVELERSGRRHAAHPALSVPWILTAAAATLLIGLALVLPLLTGEHAPSALDIHALSTDGPTASAPPTDPARPGLLAAQLAGVDFPEWGAEFGWDASGQRHDEIDGRETRSVFYEHEGHTIAYTVVSGSPLALPADAEHVRANGLDVALVRDSHGHDIAIFERQGRTCVLSGHVLRRSTLVNLASWEGDGEVRF